MGLLSALIRRRDIWKRILVERLTEPLHLNLLSLPVLALGTTRAKIAFDLLVRQQHAYGLLRAADQAKARGLGRVTVIELGVGSGTGLLNLCDLGQRVTRATGVEFEVFGFDTGRGMPPPRDYRDHPELYREGYFPMDQCRLAARLPANARLVFGSLAETVPAFVESALGESAPLGFATLDVDYYCSSKDALRLFLGRPACYLPVVPIYVDDLHHDSHNPFCGELLAISEFNAEHTLRKISPDRFLPFHRVIKHAEWLAHMHKLDVLDHPERNRLEQPEAVIVHRNPYLDGVGPPVGTRPARRGDHWKRLEQAAKASSHQA